jgi:hypothetical protein
MKIVRPFGLAFFISLDRDPNPRMFCVAKRIRGFGEVQRRKESSVSYFLFKQTEEALAAIPPSQPN